MANDLAVIKRLGKILGRKLKKRGYDEIRYYRNRGFSLDENERVTELNLSDCDISNLPPYALENLSQSSQPPPILCPSQKVSNPTKTAGTI
jgi:hypothetical protein